jgi:hypothetical protein
LNTLVHGLLRLLAREEPGAEHHVGEHCRNNNERNQYDRCLKASEPAIIPFKRIHEFTFVFSADTGSYASLSVSLARKMSL